MMKPILCAGLALMLATTSAVAQELNATERSLQELRAKVEAADDAARQQRIKNLHARRVRGIAFEIAELMRALAKRLQMDSGWGIHPKEPSNHYEYLSVRL